MKALTNFKALLGATIASAAFAVAQAQSITMWTTEEQPDRMLKQVQMAVDFKAATGISVTVIPVTESQMGTRATAAAAAGDLPDVIYYPLQYALPWAEAGIIDTDATGEAVANLGADTFRAGALGMVEVDGGYAGTPVDGWTQLVVYRKDIFEENGLEAPTSYANVVAAIEALEGKVANPFIAPNKVDEGFMSQVLEHVLLANGVTPVDDNGLAALDETATIEALEFYKTIVDASPEGELYWKQSREGYFAGDAAMIIWSPFILDELAGLRNSAPPTFNGDTETRALADATGIVTTFSGPSNPDGAAWADVRYLGVTADSDEVDAAIAFIEYSLSDGYGQTLSIAPEGKFPVRPGATAGSTEYVDLWSTLDVGIDRRAPLSELYSAETIASIASGLETATRWGVTEGQLALASKINNSRVLNVLVREYIDGVRDAAATVAMMNEELAKID